MTLTTLVDVSALALRLGDPDWCIVDCRFSLADPEAGRRAYREAHIPGAVYAHLDEDLSGAIIPGRTGRHPLPSIDVAAARLSEMGIDGRVQVVVYDDAAGAIAARLWWMLRWLGHDAVAVLDGGWKAWLADDRPVRGGSESRMRRQFEARPRPAMIVDADVVERSMVDSSACLIDAREKRRYLGVEEPIDPVAGHIPGAISVPYRSTVDESDRMLPPEALRARFREVADRKAICYCGSGVTAAHLVLAMVHAGLNEPALYAGSWSEWITRPERSVARK
ncbi:MAG: sulfurtransferase [Bacteroidota bacterium]